MYLNNKGHHRWQHHALVFLLFFVLSACLWLLSSLGTRQVVTFSIPLKFTDVPEGYVINTRLPRTVDVDLRDTRQNLLMMRYFSDRCDTMRVSLTEWFDSVNSRSVIDNASLHNVIVGKMRLGSSTNVEQFYPHELTVGYAHLHKKVVPLKLSGNFSLRRQYIYRTPISVEPRVVTLYGSERDLSSIKEVTTEAVNVEDLTKNWSEQVRIVSDERIKVVPNVAHVSVEVEPFTEQKLEMPVVPIHVPNGVTMRTFPAKVHVIFNVGLSHYNDADTSSFVVEADYNQTLSMTNDRVRLTVRSKVDFAHQIHVFPQDVEVMIEQ